MITGGRILSVGQGHAIVRCCMQESALGLTKCSFYGRGRSQIAPGMYVQQGCKQINKNK